MESSSSSCLSESFEGSANSGQGQLQLQTSGTSSSGNISPAGNAVPRRVWTDVETRELLSLMRGDEDNPGYFERIKSKKIGRNRAFQVVL